MDAGTRRSNARRGSTRRRWRRIPCRAVFLDAGGVIVLPHRELVVAALARVGIEIGASTVAPAHYQAVRDLDRAHDVGATASYVSAFCRALGVARAQTQDAIDAIAHLADRARSGVILWSEAAPHAQGMIGALRRAGIEVFVVTNSDGHATENLRDAHICRQDARAPPSRCDESGEALKGAQPATARECSAPYRGAVVDGVIDSGLVGYAKPHPAIFRVALERARTEAAATVHVGDTVSADITGASAAGIVPIHLDPGRRCRESEHRHLRSLNGLWQHVTAPTR